MRFKAALAFAACLAALCAAGIARAQTGLGALAGGKGQTLSKDKPVTFTADQVVYDRERALVTASGKVEAWQDDTVVRADKITFDRNTNILAASGHVVLLQPDGQVVFSDYAELAEGMKDGVLRGMRGILAQNGRLAANGARRTGGEITELSRVVYTTCDLCAKDPTRPPLWQIRAYTGVEDSVNKRIEYYDGVVEFYGVPVLYLPYMNHADPSVKRETGLLIPNIGESKYLGAFISIPYYVVLDDQSDVTITPMFTTKSGANIDLEWRRRFNDGEIKLNGSTGELNGHEEGAIYGKGRFNWDETWRYGFDVDRVSTNNYARDFQLGRFIGGLNTTLVSDVFAEGFGEGAFARLDARAYQDLTIKANTLHLPNVAPRFIYSFTGPVDPLGGRLSVDTQSFNIFRESGDNTRQAGLSVNWSRPFAGYLGEQWKFQLHADGMAYDANRADQIPDYAYTGHLGGARVQPQAALDMKWPFMRDSGAWGTQILEPMVEGVAGPNTGNSQFLKVPNEDSVDSELTDANLFGFNRFTGLDRLTGGSRLNVAMHAAWYLDGTALDGLFGQSYQTEREPYLPPGSGWNGTVSDYVGRVSFAPVKWMDLTYRARFDHHNMQVQMQDALATFTFPHVSTNFGYLYSKYDPEYLYDQAQFIQGLSVSPNSYGDTYNGNDLVNINGITRVLPASYFTHRNEVYGAVHTNWGHYRLGTDARFNVQSGQLVSIGADVAYEDECFVLDFKFARRYYSIDGDSGSTLGLVSITLKSVGQFGFHVF